MDKKGKIYIVLTIIALLGIVVFESTKPQALNWYPSYTKHHKIPFGTFILHEQLERLFSKHNIIDVERPPYEYLNSNDSITGTYLFINNQIGFDKAELDKLLDWTSKGNTLFIASETINKTLLDTINANNSVISSLNNFDNVYQFKLKNKALKKNDSYTFDKADFINYFNKVDTLNTSVISVVNNAADEDLQTTKDYINTIKHPFGNGHIILSTLPQAFTNYFLLTNPNQNYTAGLLSYIPASQPIYVDAYYKSGKTFYSSPMHVFLNTKELKWAYYIMLISVFIYVVFEGKRKQRAIPVIKPLKNQTLDFTRTIANMYYEKQNHYEIAQHKIQLFLDYIRTQLYLDTNVIDTSFVKKLADRTNNSVKDTQQLFKGIENINNKTTLTKNELEALNTRIESFKSNNSWKKTF
ncbi:DUF4350 domain-containing protein [Snuella sedimenti]|uniref:DUF4350 domain-containing protein n=1 Tax=Snuella sedimenti TaxID=2798802 RepID=A0A8J7LNW9_9FLAO|nr:DUF4350 domain-containing protein [Snuella sedimenti]MBJ6368488.1 DUF4350 domain-containing protein [Snuella sedimenti]